VRLAAALLALVTGCAAHAAAPRSREVRVRIELSRFVPSVIDVRAGATVRFVVANTDPIDHEFIVGDAAVHARHERGTEAAHGAVPGEVSVPAETTASTTFRFDAPGEWVFACHLPGHFGYGMRGVVRVR
jgi:uncharacterized cupredoxin-like copper-binding protein